jgi:NTP pyrophosphatase (non-canonical NTP hydrolase)
MNPKYLPTTTEGKMGRVAEEAGEVVQAIGKILRFGFFSRYPADAPNNNVDDLLSEMEDLEDAIKRFRPDLEAIRDNCVS